MYVDKNYLEKYFDSKGVVSASIVSENNPSCSKKLPSLDADNHKDQKRYTPEKAFSKIERLVALRDRSVHEIRERLDKVGFPQPVIDEAIERAIRCGFLDDARFAETYLVSKIRAKKGLDGVLRNLKTFGIDINQLEHFPEAYLPPDYDAVSVAVDLLASKPPRAKNKRQAAYAKLMRDGYSSSDAYEAAALWEASL